MSRFILESDLGYLREIYPDIDIKRPTTQQERSFVLYMRGLTPHEAAKQGGYRGTAAFLSFLNSPTGQVLQEFYAQKTATGVAVDRELLTSLLVEAHAKAGTATEEIMAIRELGKLHNQYLDSQQAKKVEINVNTAQNMKQIQNLTEEELLQLASPEVKALLEAPVATQSGSESTLVDQQYEPIRDI